MEDAAAFEFCAHSNVRLPMKNNAFLKGVVFVAGDDLFYILFQAWYFGAETQTFHFQKLNLKLSAPDKYSTLLSPFHSSPL
jgi:hypothetical protein